MAMYINDREKSLSQAVFHRLKPGPCGRVHKTDRRWCSDVEPNLTALVYSAVHMEESSVMQGAQGMLVQNWPTVSSAAALGLSPWW
ncbi:unnamed protein product [Arctogadus glacialis]